jgi:hypothetical protein
MNWEKEICPKAYKMEACIWFGGKQALESGRG